MTCRGGVQVVLNRILIAVARLPFIQYSHNRIKWRDLINFYQFFLFNLNDEISKMSKMLESG